MMENNTTFQDCEEAEDTISLCDLPIHDHGPEFDDSSNHNRKTSTDQDLFEFFSDLSSEMSHSDNNIVFCGKMIPYDEDELNEYRKRDYLSVRSSSFHKSYKHQINEDTDHFGSMNRSNLIRSPSSDSNPNRCVAKGGSSSIQKVNITSITSMSAKSRRRMMMFGPVKFKPEMELSAIKKRQSRRAPVPMFPAVLGGSEIVTSGGKGGKSHWGLVRSLRFRTRSTLVNVLARSFGCISVSVV